VVARRDCGDACADGLDDPGPFVAEDDRERIGRRPGDDVPVAVADAARVETDDDLAVARIRQLDLLDAERLVDGSQDGGPHAPILSPCRLAPVKARAAVLWRPGEPVEILEVDLAPPKAGEVLVKIAACGVCASDLHVVDGELPEPMPLVLGHEASGLVVETGPGVEGLKEGDHVVLALVPSCGRCRPCREGRPNFCEVGGRMAATGTLADGTSRLSVNGTELHHFNSVSSLADYAVVPESAAVAIRQDMPLDVAALFGCAVITGYGAVVNTARVEAGASVAVWGCGGVGLNCIQSARLAGAATILAIDVSSEKLEAARRFGATTVVNAQADDPVSAVRDATGGLGADYVFEAIGREETVRQAWDAARAGGTVVVVGMIPKGQTLTIDPWHFIYEKTLKGCFLGSARIAIDIPRLANLYVEGRLQLDELVSRKLPLAELPEAFDRLRAGDVLRQVVVFD
jgi:S-(hydroxymethyl)glutathione dehydrogenase/alcohol dehydrogenase